MLLDKTKTLKEVRFYASSALECGWSRNVLLNFIKANAYESQALPKHHNFERTLPVHMQVQANEILKDRYNLAFLGTTKPILELELEKRLIEKIKYFMLELGKGFSFIGNQYKLTLSNKEYFVDLLFFNRYTKSLVAVELKIGEFEPEYIGKMNFYLTLLDSQVKLPDENPSIGIILCANKDNVEVNVALQDVEKPIGVSEYQLVFPEKQLKDVIAIEIQNMK